MDVVLYLTILRTFLYSNNKWTYPRIEILIPSYALPLRRQQQLFLIPGLDNIDQYHDTDDEIKCSFAHGRDFMSE